MPAFCAVLNCSDKYGHAENISFHKFPFKRKDLLQQWLTYTGRDNNWQPSRWSCICSRHFRSDDFNGINERKTLKKTAVPTLKELECVVESAGAAAATAAQPKSQRNVDEDDSLDALAEAKTSGVNAPKVNCRLCGRASTAVVSFSANFEIYGMIQKCFPTLNIQQHDNLSKEMCRVCLQRLESFSRFIDIVLETQSELQRKYRAEKQNTNSSSSSKGANERQLKIKQEPVVRVKQEVSEGFDSFLSDDVDMGVDDGCCEQEHGTGNSASGSGGGGNDVDQKYQLCDFPAMLNTQDIINNCDIMEIINLEDAFIDIPDDDGNTTIDEPIGVPKQQRHHQEEHHQQQPHQANQLQQLHTQQSQPTTQQQQQQQAATAQAPTASASMLSAYDLLQTHLLIEEHNYANVAEDFKEEWQIKNHYKTEKCDEYGDEADADADDVLPHYPHSSDAPTTPHDKPIVTSVAAVANGKSGRTHTKPNIVVLNESIVQSASAFQLHACTVCQLNFFSIETLRTHSLQQHSMSLPAAVDVHTPLMPPPPPMVRVPIDQPCAPPERYCKMEKGQEEANALTTQSWTELAVDAPPSQPNRINILEMESLIGNFGQQQAPPPPTSLQQMTQRVVVSNCDAYAAAALEQPPVQAETLTPANNKLKLEQMATNYNRLQRRYRQLQRKCRHLQVQRTTAKDHAARAPHRQCPMPCRVCGQHFARIGQLLRHKQTAAHFVHKPLSRFAATCGGCEKFFRSKLALRNHMRYICATLPLRARQMLMFKCRHCRSITFTHWRLCRRHELRCRARLQRQSKKRPPQHAQLPPAKRTHSVLQSTPRETRPLANRVVVKRAAAKAYAQRFYKCHACAKTFASSNSLSQHNITHTQARRHKCTLCERHFKRRNGLTQHMRGYHLQLKPYTCPVCQHSYALKGDMQRCRHSVLGGGALIAPTPTTTTTQLHSAATTKRQLGVT